MLKNKTLKIVIVVNILLFLAIIIKVNVSKYIEIKRVEDLPKMQEIQGDTWYKDTNIVGHAGGHIDRYVYTNSKEAVLHTLEQGINVIEIDFDYTSDGHLVCYHLPYNINDGINEMISFKDFMKQKIQGTYTPITPENVFEYMRENPEFYVAVDTKHESLTEVVKDLVKICPDKQLLNRLIIQCYYPGEKIKILNVYNFPEENIVYTSYKHTDNPYKVIEICIKENYNVALMDYRDLNEKTIKLFKDKNIYLYVFTVNDAKKADKLFEQGIHGIYTDFLY